MSTCPRKVDDSPSRCVARGLECYCRFGSAGLVCCKRNWSTVNASGPLQISLVAALSSRCTCKVSLLLKGVYVREPEDILWRLSEIALKRELFKIAAVIGRILGFAVLSLRL